MLTRSAADPGRRLTTAGRLVASSFLPHSRDGRQLPSPVLNHAIDAGLPHLGQYGDDLVYVGHKPVLEPGALHAVEHHGDLFQIDVIPGLVARALADLYLWHLAGPQVSPIPSVRGTTVNRRPVPARGPSRPPALRA